MCRALASGLVAALLAALAPVAGCAEVAGLDRFHKRVSTQSAQDGSEYLDLELSFSAMKPHGGHLFEYRVIDANNFIQSRGIVRTLTSGDTNINAPRALPRGGGPYRLDFFADVNHSGGFDGIGSVISNDHAWRIEPLEDRGDEPEVPGLVRVKWVHNTTFTNIDQWPSGTNNPPTDTELPARVRLTGLDHVRGKLLEVKFVDRGTGRLVGLYRLTRVEEPATDIVVPGCIERVSDYDVDIYVDANGNDQYDSPASGSDKDRGYRIAATSSDTGLELAFDLASATGGNIDVGAP